MDPLEVNLTINATSINGRNNICIKIMHNARSKSRFIFKSAQTIFALELVNYELVEVKNASPQSWERTLMGLAEGILKTNTSQVPGSASATAV
jgi:hypothetical protein